MRVEFEQGCATPWSRCLHVCPAGLWLNIQRMTYSRVWCQRTSNAVGMSRHVPCVYTHLCPCMSLCFSGCEGRSPFTFLSWELLPLHVPRSRSGEVSGFLCCLALRHCAVFRICFVVGTCVPSCVGANLALALAAAGVLVAGSVSHDQLLQSWLCNTAVASSGGRHLYLVGGSPCCG